jgi:hypothetical protein
MRGSVFKRSLVLGSIHAFKGRRPRNRGKCRIKGRIRIRIEGGDEKTHPRPPI